MPRRPGPASAARGAAMCPRTVYRAPSGGKGHDTPEVFVFSTLNETGSSTTRLLREAPAGCASQPSNAPSVTTATTPRRAPAAEDNAGIAMLYHSYEILVAVTRDGGASIALRPALIEAAARLIATEGAAALTLRRVADEVGTSTMAIYTHFGGMSELRRAVRQEGFARLAARAARVRETDDPVADLAVLGREYYEHAMSD